MDDKNDSRIPEEEETSATETSIPQIVLPPPTDVEPPTQENPDIFRIPPYSGSRTRHLQECSGSEQKTNIKSKSVIVMPTKRTQNLSPEKSVRMTKKHIQSVSVSPECSQDLRSPQYSPNIRTDTQVYFKHFIEALKTHNGLFQHCKCKNCNDLAPVIRNISVCSEISSCKCHACQFLKVLINSSHEMQIPRTSSVQQQSNAQHQPSSSSTSAPSKQRAESSSWSKPPTQENSELLHLQLSKSNPSTRDVQECCVSEQETKRKSVIVVSPKQTCPEKSVRITKEHKRSVSKSPQSSRNVESKQSSPNVRTDTFEDLTKAICVLFEHHVIEGLKIKERCECKSCNDLAPLIKKICSCLEFSACKCQACYYLVESIKCAFKPLIQRSTNVQQQSYLQHQPSRSSESTDDTNILALMELYMEHLFVQMRAELRVLDQNRRQVYPRAAQQSVVNPAQEIIDREVEQFFESQSK